jgi:hypothetical protein
MEQTPPFFATPSKQAACWLIERTKEREWLGLLPKMVLAK